MCRTFLSTAFPGAFTRKETTLHLVPHGVHPASHSSSAQCIGARFKGSPPSDLPIPSGGSPLSISSHLRGGMQIFVKTFKTFPYHPRVDSPSRPHLRGGMQIFVKTPIPSWSQLSISSHLRGGMQIFVKTFLFHPGVYPPSRPHLRGGMQIFVKTPIPSWSQLSISSPSAWWYADLRQDPHSIPESTLHLVPSAWWYADLRQDPHSILPVESTLHLVPSAWWYADLRRDLHSIPESTLHLVPSAWCRTLPTSRLLFVQRHADNNY
ncbi:hypothetical protein FRC03_010007 [Tulasnella sp. 419]|nr:hypothetical protein FRC03_010007 [Tulasnella sp. 419]